MQNYIVALSNGEADSTVAANFYRDVLGSLAALPVITRRDTVAHNVGTVTQPAEVVEVLLALYGGQQLGELSVREANWLLSTWRASAGPPYNFVRESVNQRDFLLIPQPASAGSAALISSVSPTGDIPAWLVLPVALLVLGMEYRRESDHQHTDLAAAFTLLGNFLLRLAIGDARSAAK